VQIVKEVIPGTTRREVREWEKRGNGTSQGCIIGQSPPWAARAQSCCWIPGVSVEHVP
jgi:hypothetical protein